MSELTKSAVIDGELVEPKQPTEREQWIAGIRALASFFEAHPELPLSCSSVSLLLFPNLEEMPKYVGIFGKMKKDVIGDAYFQLKKTFFDSNYHRIELCATWNRDTVCEKVVTGRKKVMQKVQTKPPETVDVEVEVETFEWKCPRVAGPPAELVEGE